LWLRWVKDRPNPWRIAHHKILPDGDGLLPKKLLGRVPANIRLAVRRNLIKAKRKTSSWVYEIKGNAFRHSRMRIDEIEIAQKIKKEEGQKEDTCPRSKTRMAALDA
jgi:hypothetical protein